MHTQTDFTPDPPRSNNNDSLQEGSIASERLQEILEHAGQLAETGKKNELLKYLRKEFIKKQEAQQELEKKLSRNEKILQAQNASVKRLQTEVDKKNVLINELWHKVQSMRLSRRVLSILNLMSIIKKLNAVIKLFIETVKKKINFQRSLKQLKKEKSEIVNFIKNHYDHSPAVQHPRVSIIILNRNGYEHLTNLFKNWKDNVCYLNYEIIVFDNDSTDNSIQFLEHRKDLNIKIIRNSFNDTFSSANNKAASTATGELLLFLNNDVQPLYGWLNQLVKTYCQHKNDAGCIGSTLLYPIKSGEKSSLNIQHTGIGFRLEEGFVRPYNLDNNTSFWNHTFNNPIERAGVTAACLLIPKQRFEEVQGFDEQYVYGYEDVDLNLKLLEKGYKNYLAAQATLFHYEFGTQETQPSIEVANRRKKNLEYFRSKWYRKLLNLTWAEMLNKNEGNLFAGRKLNVGIVVTEQGSEAVAGDYFTAHELALALSNFGWNIRYYAQKENNWYSIHNDTDILIVLLHKYDLSKIECKNRGLIKIAWIRNWFEHFTGSPWFDSYDIVLSSSKLACHHIYETTKKTAHYMPIATNPERFTDAHSASLHDPIYTCDYCFTGSYWNVHREIIDFLDPESLPSFTFNLYGKNWERVEKLEPYAKGFIPYEDLPKVYANTKILIDDANSVTKPWGSVNSRVFDAINSGVLVITNGTLGSMDVFDGELPYYESKEDLNHLIGYYLTNETARQEKISALKKIVAERHTYRYRAVTIQGILSRYYNDSIVIKVASPDRNTAHHWGDYHFALALKKELEATGYRVKINLLKEWDAPEFYSFPNVLVLRGLSKYTTKPFQFNMMWNISHPDMVSHEEYTAYDHVFVASEKWATHLKEIGHKNISTLLQCTDPTIFKVPEESEKVPHQLLFIGNSRNIKRKIIQDVLPPDYDLSIYGTNWGGIVDDTYLKGEHIDNRDLFKYYGSAKILLNDHWEDMREKGFISNRIFDALACNATIISDYMEDIESTFGSAVYLYKNEHDLRRLIHGIMSNTLPAKREDMSLTIKNKHTFEIRAKEIINQILAHTQNQQYD
jgi:GT2 family glycosyltransferase/spore maturation protein CgeB